MEIRKEIRERLEEVFYSSQGKRNYIRGGGFVRMTIWKELWRAVGRKVQDD